MRAIFLTMVAALTLAASYAQEIKEVEIKDFTLQIKEDGNLNVDIEIDFTRLNIKTTQVVVLTPVIINNDRSQELNSIAIYGRNRRIYYKRNEDIRPTSAEDVVLTPSQARDVVSYNTSVHFADWMDGCRVELMRNDYGCCGEPAMVGRRELVDRFPIEPYIPELLYLRPQHEVVKTRQINGSAFVDFPVSQTVIYPTYRNNIVELAKITGTIDSVKRDQDITIKSITIKGYASPESPYDHNARLAEGRTEALKAYVEGLYNFDSGLITTAFEPEDWAGLESYVAASEIENKDAILEIISNNETPDRKEWIIKSNYPNEYRYLLDNCYPALRRSDYTVYYTVRKYSDPAEIESIMATAPQKLSLEEFYILAQTYEPGSAELDELWEVAVRMYPNDEIANFNAANSAMNKGDYERAARYLSKAGNRPEVDYSLGCIEVLKEQYEASLDYLYKAKEAGIEEATPVIDAAENHWKVTRNRK